MLATTAKALGLSIVLGAPLAFAGTHAVEASTNPCDAPAVTSPIEATAPNILSNAELSAEELTEWWSAKGRGQPANLGMPINEVIAIYLEEAAAEGVRGDLAFAQAVHETGWFTNNDTLINNFAGIGHYDDAPSGFAYPDVRTGVRAHIQLLKKFSAGNGVGLANESVSPTAGAHTPTWPGLAGTWATDPQYWPKLAFMYDQMHLSERMDDDSCEAASTPEVVPAVEVPAEPSVMSPEAIVPTPSEISSPVAQ